MEGKGRRKRNGMEGRKEKGLRVQGREGKENEKKTERTREIKREKEKI